MSRIHSQTPKPNGGPYHTPQPPPRSYPMPSNNRITKPKRIQRPRHTTVPVSSSSIQPTQCNIIGHLFADDRWGCPYPSCSDITFGRKTELKRHHASCHKGFGGDEPQFWCPVDGCERSIQGGEPFPRQDKMVDHLKRVHKDKVSGAS
jgi:hypothetical protein